MFENTRKRLSVYFFRKNILAGKSSEIKNFNTFYTESKTFLLVAPGSHSEADNLKAILNSLEKDGKQVTVLLDETLINYLPDKIKKQGITYTKESRTKLDLPEKGFYDTIKGKQFDVVIDLNREENLFCSILTNCVESGFRIGFTKENSDLFYNFQITKAGGQMGDLPKNLLDSLAMF